MITSPTILTPTANGAVPAVPGIAFTLTNGGLTWTNEGSDNTSGQAFGDNPLSAGSFYWEATLDDFTGTNPYYFGVCSTSGRSATQDITYSPGDIACVGFYNNSSVVVNGGGSGVSLGTAVAGSVIGIAVNIASSLVWFRLNGGNWNNSGTADPVAGTGGISISGFPTPLVPFVVGYEGAVSITFNFGQEAFSATAPSGYINWPGAEQITLSSILGSSGNPLLLAGYTANAIAGALDYSLDDGATWTACAGYTAASNWSAYGPTFAGAASGTMLIRDHANTAFVSNAVDFNIPYIAPSYANVLFGPSGETVGENPTGTSLTTETAAGLVSGDGSLHFQCAFGVHVLDYQKPGGLVGTPVTFGLSWGTALHETDPQQIVINFDRQLGIAQPGQVGISRGWARFFVANYTGPAADGWTEWYYGDHCTIVITGQITPSVGGSQATMRVTMSSNAVPIVDTGNVSDEMGHLREFVITSGGFDSTAAHAAIFSNLVIYDLTPPSYKDSPSLNCCL